MGVGELVVVLAIVIMVFGASWLPQVGEGVGRMVRALREGLRDDADV